MEENELLERALEYTNRGWRVFPVHTPTENGCSCGKSNCPSIGKHPRISNWPKDATTDENQIREWWAEWPDANIGIATGEQSGILVLDVDPQHNGFESFAELFGDKGSQEATYIARSGSGGLHLYFKSPCQKIGNRTGILPGIDIRGDGGYIVAPPSKHASGDEYRWYLGPGTELPETGEIVGEDFLTEPAPLSHWLFDILTTQKRNESPKWYKIGDENLKISEGNRNDHLASIAGILRSKALRREVIESMLIGLNRDFCDPPLPDNEVRRIAQSISGYPPGSQDLSDIGNGKRLTQQYGDQIRYCTDSDKWYVYQNGAWKKDNGRKIENLAKTIASLIYQEAENEDDDKRKAAIIKHAKKSCNASGIRSMIFMAASESEIHVEQSHFDNDPMLLNCRNGVLDLETGNLLGHSPCNLMQKMLPINFNPEATCPEWEKFLNRIMNYDEELISFLQRAVGYMLTGDISEQCFFVMHGTGANGKSTFINTIMNILGVHAKQTPFLTFLKRHANLNTNDLARLRGARLISAGEVAPGEKLDETKLKQMTGGDTITARFLFREFSDFQMEGKIVLTVNDRPEIQATDEGTWRRVMLVPFEVTIPKEERDPYLPQKLQNELEGILAWAVAGCLEWQKYGLNPPEKVMAATRDYRHEMDKLSEWIADNCEEGPDNECCDLQSALFANYQVWCNINNEKALTRKEFTRMMRDKGFVKKQKSNDPNKGRTHWFGIRRKSNWRDNDQPSPGEEIRDESLAELL